MTSIGYTAPLPTTLPLEFQRHSFPLPTAPHDFQRQSSSSSSMNEDLKTAVSRTSHCDTECGASHAPSALRNDVLACLGEFIGTFMFLYFPFLAAQSAIQRMNVDTNGTNQMDNQTILYISFAFGIRLLVNAWVLFRITGAAFNPAVSFSLWLFGGLSTRRFALVVPAQLLGAITAAGLAKVLSTGVLGVETTTAAGATNGQDVGIEMFTTGLLCFTVLFTAAEKSKSTFLAPVATGFSLFVGHLLSVGFTGAGINPARSFGPSIVNLHFTHNAWVYYVGQFLGAFLATAIYISVKQLDYNSIVAGIDTEDEKESQDVCSGLLMKIISVKAFSCH